MLSFLRLSRKADPRRLAGVGAGGQQRVAELARVSLQAAPRLAWPCPLHIVDSTSMVIGP